MSNIFDTRCLVGALGLVVLVGLPVAQAAETANVTVRVTIVAAPPCVINNNNNIEVNFGNDVLTTRVDGSAYKKMPVTYSINCSGGPSNSVKMLIEGSGAGFDNAMLRTNQTDFGIALLNNGSRYPINSWTNFNASSPPRLEAVPAKRAGVMLKGGPFSAGATMKVEYQ
ncbi:fimbrial protein [Serratia proteamaculans]|jgi:type 1 fimbria pilin|uniref:fimbrial protein n=1 Tax=Serratia proteamaculans TaxID=28151 RepID=UPI00217A826D|nr:fimbrial protein [Serratia proteamaculans]CAI0906074.1 Minor fimbrial protein prsF precursor [Serratia proteamaculans]CAI0971790.1 Minor fimbrial protein prsF precursor [Serratia proteamaculans]CAI1056781.1 Minor fimbrial protein prsF precursor [Serratia proteamaculans]CAI2010817.1 Minor fimbrial protein prsF precursor [Serratia proteamaculans]